MKKLILLTVVLTFAFAINAQIKTPQPSPLSKIEQTVGLTDVSVEYSRPSMRGRTIFGDLVPYDKMWRTGANKNTTITFSDDVTVNGQTLKAGSYAIFTKPGKESWDVYFYTDTENWGTPENWNDAKVAAKVTTPVYKMPIKIETFTITFDDLTSNSAVLGMLWEDVYTGVEFKVPTDTKVSANINQVMNGPSANDYFAAAVYYLQEDKDINQAKTWIEKSMSMTENPKFWQLRQQSLIYAKLGEKEKAIDTAKKSLEAAKAAGNSDYVKMNTDSLKEWGAL